MKLLVLREGIHGTNAADYAERLRERLPDHEVVLARTPEAEEREIADARVVTGASIDADLLGHETRLRLFAGEYAGHGHLPLDAFEERGVGLTNAAGVHAPNIAEYVVGALLSHVRGFLDAARRQERREWRPMPVGELAGSTVTIVGLGNIGGAVAEKLRAFDVETVGIRASPEKGGPADTVRGPDDLHDALSRSDAVVLACPLTDATRGLLGSAEFTTMPTDAVLVNVARGPVVDTDALVTALRRNVIGGATLDVTDPEPLPEDHPLWNFGNVQLTPHNAGATPRYYDRLADLVAGNVRLAAEEGWDAAFENLVLPVGRE
ncbi:D-2-hydroxyacid dehydrogenase [Halosegnis marinus]|uniref:D-2-hydroxyacid dehydrogenase n=1 Tax=Halosegnis marinus TaxID=3034023 RepID=A0ABD5ZL01_9EURY|nr:D-2-hydroxyacid dehydrogenase [Halosegnis sp. DT85]